MPLAEFPPKLKYTLWRNWRGNYTLDCTPQEYNDRIQLEIRCYRYYPMPSDTYSSFELEDMGFYGLYERNEAE